MIVFVTDGTGVLLERRVEDRNMFRRAAKTIDLESTCPVHHKERRVGEGDKKTVVMRVLEHPVID